MIPESLRNSIAEAERFLRAAKKANSGIHKNQYGTMEFASQSETAAVKRASLDLSKALSAMRNPK